ncbi:MULTISPECIES: hypothetical protein [unclassified Nocardioides]|uniref:hypothetical protein n=1 Tax=unclassified Nocardioides TaxID=2615069 RepID=UPI0006F2883D|nr:MULTISPECIES: hypothetical protein [unclassified Nocardioides]KRA38572.1 hypothetical protein ASD81_08130 [Nocardioides sp. Root614]KRA92532.1 hypothetical protein ASD84_08395 [Nocardioides sp. Root682]
MNEGAAQSDDVTVASADRRLSLVTVDQLLSSVSNIAALIWAAHVLAPADFGRFSLVMMVYWVAQVALRSMISTTVLVHPEDADNQPRAILSSTLALSLFTGVLCVVPGLALAAVDSPLGMPIIVLGALLPLLLVHDVGRYLAIARQRPAGAVSLDLIWVVLMVATFGATIALDRTTLSWLIFAWALPGGIASLWVFAQNGLPAGAWRTWLRERWHFSWRSLVGGLSASGTALVTASLMTVFSDALAVAAFRSATLLAAPSTAVQMAVATAAAADVARDREVPGAYWHHVRRAIVISAIVGLLNLVLLVFLPDVVGRAVLGDSWEIVEPLMLAVSLKVLLMAAQSGVRAALIGRHHIQVAMWTDVISIALVGVSMVVGAALGDAEGGLWGMAVGTGISTVCWWVALWWKGRGDAPEPQAVQAPKATPGKHARRPAGAGRRA